MCEETLTKLVTLLSGAVKVYSAADAVYFLTEVALQPKKVKVGSHGAKLSYYGCTVNIPHSALEEEIEICLEILNNELPKGLVSPLLRLEPSDLNFNCPVTVTLPLVISPSHETPESECPQVTLMCRRHGEWSKVQSTTLSHYDELSFQCSHFSDHCYFYEGDSNKTVKRVACYLYKRIPKGNYLEVIVSICDDLQCVIEVNMIPIYFIVIDQ